MRKYFAFAKTSFQQDLFYRTNFFFYFIRQSLWFLVQILFFRVVFGGNLVIADYNYLQIVEYFLIVYLINLVAFNRADSYIGKMIVNGELSKELVQPLSFFWKIFFHFLGKRIYRLIYVMVVIFLLLVLGKMDLGFSKIVLFLLILANASFLTFIYRFLLGTLAFWLMEITSVLWFFRQGADFLAGGWLPISFFPAWAGKLMKSLPFYLTLGFPAEFFQDKISGKMIFLNLVQQFGWIILLFWLAAFFWAKGVKHYEAVGN